MGMRTQAHLAMKASEAKRKRRNFKAKFEIRWPNGNESMASTA
jgi:hypothetical protein